MLRIAAVYAPCQPEPGSRKPIDIDHLSFAHGEATLAPEGPKQLGSITNVQKTFPHYRLIVFGNAESSELSSMDPALASGVYFVAWCSLRHVLRLVPLLPRREAGNRLLTGLRGLWKWYSTLQKI